MRIDQVLFIIYVLCVRFGCCFYFYVFKEIKEFWLSDLFLRETWRSIFS